MIDRVAFCGVRLLVYITILYFMEISSTITILAMIGQFFDPEEGGCLQSLRVGT